MIKKKAGLYIKKCLFRALMAGVTLFFYACAGHGGSSNSEDSSQDSGVEEIPADYFDSSAIAVDTVEKEELETFRPEDFAGFSSPQMEYMRKSPDADKYLSGILPVIAKEVPQYATKLLNNQYDGFLVVDKASLRVLLYDRYGRQQRAYDMACAKNYGNKHKKADSRTPEGFFSVEGIYDSTDWLFTDDNGVTSKKKGQFGPRFIRLRIPTTSQIGIHGTCAPWSIGSRASHGCIRITNENIMELVDLVTPGMPAIVLPGKRDRKVNREEGYESLYFPTAPKYAMTAAEKKLTPEEPKPEETDSLETVVSLPDSLAPPSENIDTVDRENGNEADTIQMNHPATLPDSVPVPE